MRLTYLQTFITVIKEESISKAANTLFLTQPAVSKQIKLLEEYYDTPLIKKENRKIKLTREGEELFKFATNIISLDSDLALKLNHFKNNPIGEISILSSNFPANYYLPKVFSSFRINPKQLSFSIEITDSSEVFEKVNLSLVPFGFIGKKITNKNIISHKITSSKMFLVGLEKYKNLIDNKKYSLNELPFILRKEGSGSLNTIIEHLNNNSISEINIFIKADNNNSVKKYILNGLGVGYLTEEELNSKDCDNLQILDNRYITRDFYFIYNKNRHLSLVENLFKNHILNIINNSKI